MFRRLFCLLMFLCLTACCPRALASEYDEVFVIVHTNDVHGYIDIEPYVKALADDMKARYGEKNVLTVSAGDVFAGGNAVAHLYKGETIPPIMEAAGYDILVPGNNDIIPGRDQLLSLAGMFGHTKVLCANMFDLSSPDRMVFDGTMITETEGGVKIGLFGLTTKLALLEKEFAITDTISGARSAVSSLQDAGCAVIVGVGHTGWNDDLVTPSANDVTSAEVVRAVPGIDVFVDAHSHSVINEGRGWICPETGTLVNQASCKGACAGVITIYIRDGAAVEKTAELLTLEELKARYMPDPGVLALVNAAWDRLAGDMGEKYALTPYYLNGLRTAESVDGRSVRTDETNLGDLVADFLRDYSAADVAMVPGVLIRGSIDAGDIHTLNLYDVFALGCPLYVYEMSGEDLLLEMASSLSELPYESPVFRQISGASFGYLPAYTLSEDGDKVFTIIDPMVGGEKLDPKKIYTVAIGEILETPEGMEPLMTTMEEAAAAMGDYLETGEAVFLPDVVLPAGRITPMEAIPEGALVYQVELDSGE